MTSPTRVTRSLRLVSDLCDALRRAEVDYCHWKSTDALDRSATGENDLDLLVAEHDIPRFRAVLRELACVEAVGPRSHRVPGVRHFYGLDVGSLRLVDVHAHERLIVGDDATKNYRLPVEGAYLATSTVEDLFPIPAPELEFAVFIVRMSLKHGSPEAILTGRGGLSAAETDELRSLRERTDAPDRWRSLDRLGPMLDAAAVERCLRALEPGASLMVRWQAWRDLRRRLAPYARHPRAVDVWLQSERRLVGRTRRLVGRPRRKRPLDGGRVIAVVGGDGSGKSTVVTGLDELLSPVFATARIHLGKPPRSLSWLAVRVWLRIGRRLGLPAADPMPDAGPGGQRPVGPPSRSRLLIHALTARDRRRAALRARRLASRGAIVLCDRYPRPEIAVDGPHAGEHEPTAAGRLLVEMERRELARIPPPDVVVALSVPPEVARRRRLEADAAVIETRAREILDAEWREGVVVVDGARPREEVLAEVAAAVWETL